jgi:hypothetical protein
VPITTDRGEIIHFAGRHLRSPALIAGAPALVEPRDRSGRCGWAAFFAALDRAGGAAELGADGSLRAVPRGRVGT